MNRLLTYLILIIVASVAAGCGETRKDEGDKIIERIYSFKEEHNRYPNKLEEIGIESDESGPFYYLINKDHSNFQLYYGLSLGESETYYSSTKSWSERE